MSKKTRHLADCLRRTHATGRSVRAGPGRLPAETRTAPSYRAVSTMGARRSSRSGVPFARSRTRTAAPSLPGAADGPRLSSRPSSRCEPAVPPGSTSWLIDALTCVTTPVIGLRGSPCRCPRPATRRRRRTGRPSSTDCALALGRAGFDKEAATSARSDRRASPSLRSACSCFRAAGYEPRRHSQARRDVGTIARTTSGMRTTMSGVPGTTSCPGSMSTCTTCARKSGHHLGALGCQSRGPAPELRAARPLRRTHGRPCTGQRLRGCWARVTAGGGGVAASLRAQPPEQGAQEERRKQQVRADHG